jgi:hypothetical protein
VSKVSRPSGAPGASESSDSSSRFSARKTSNRQRESIFTDAIGERLTNLIDIVTGEGDLISFSRTSDGGAVCIHVLSGKESEKWYATDEAELGANLGDIFGYYT